MVLKRLFFIIAIALLGEFSFAQTTKPATSTKPGVMKSQPAKSATSTKPGVMKSQPAKPATATQKPATQNQGAKPATGQTKKPASKTAPKKVTTLDDKQYRGMADMGFSWGIANGKEFNRFSISTTHGYQVVPIYLFIGGGIEVDYFTGGKGFSVPLYLDLRTNFKAKVSPFIDARVGGSPIDLKGFYASPSFGVRIPIKETICGISLMAGYTYQTADMGFYYYSKNITTEDKKKMSGIHFKLAVEW